MSGKVCFGLEEERLSAPVDLTCAEVVFEYISGTSAVLIDYYSKQYCYKWQ